MKQLTEDTRERALAAWRAGKKINEICEVLGINRRTFYNWRKREENGGRQKPLPKGRPPKILDARALIQIKELYETDNSLYAREVLDKLGLNCSLGVIYRALAELGLTFKKKK